MSGDSDHDNNNHIFETEARKRSAMWPVAELERQSYVDHIAKEKIKKMVARLEKKLDSHYRQASQYSISHFNILIPHMFKLYRFPGADTGADASKWTTTKFEA